VREVEEAAAVALEAGDVLVLGQVEEGLADEFAANVVDGRGEVLVAGGLGDLGEGGADGGGAGDVGGDAEGSAAEGVDLGDDRIVGGRGASEEEDCGVGGREFEGEGSAWWCGVS